MKIARVIVDVPAKQTDKLFDYLIPSHLKDIILPGMRVIVPFGPRMVQAFVLERTNKSEFTQLKNIADIMDLQPVLNKELLLLANWLTTETLCFKITALQAMLPAALKAKYTKKFKKLDKETAPFLSEETRKHFEKSTIISWEDAVENNLLPLLKKEVEAGTIEIIYEVKERLQKKKIKWLEPSLPMQELKQLMESLPSQASKQKEVLAHFINQPKAIMHKDLLASIGVSSTTVKSLIQKGILVEKLKEVYRDPYENRVFKRTEPLVLTNEQQQVIQPILYSIVHQQHDVFLLYGVTGSGKTEVYLQSIQKVIENGKEAIVLVPEISLTPQMVHRFKSRFGNEVAVMHSGLSIGEKYDEWRKIQRKEVKVVVGARSAIFAPFENIGIIIIDEEHETSYKQEENPRYHARNVAIERGSYHNCPVVLGSATPSLETFARTQKNVFTRLTMQKRMNNQSLPTVEIVDMREELRSGNRSMFSTVLFDKIKDRLEKDEQIVLFLNRRGHSSFVMCRDCGYVVQCPNCEISLTYHRFEQKLKCHYCGFDQFIPKTCPECNSDHIRYFGTGTQKVEEELGKLLPEAKVIRMDVDTTSKKGAHETLLTAFQEGKADILLGTQMIAKGLDFPNITLVGVLSADTMLHLPDFRASEKTFQLLTQVSGRAGRHEKPGEVVIQTYSPEHYSIILAGKQDYDAFYQREMMSRKWHHYPPFYYLTLVTISHEELMKVVSVTEKITHYLKANVSNEAIVLGPVASPIPRINNRYRYQCLVKYKREEKLGIALKTILSHYQQDRAGNGLKISIDVNPYIMM